MKRFPRAKVSVIAVTSVLFFLLAGSILFFQFSPVGYRMTVRYHGFDEVGDRIFIDRHFTEDQNEALAVIASAKQRVAAFWGTLYSSPVIIISDDTQKIARLGGDHDTKTVVFLDAASYIALSSEYLNIDVAAHELTHAELHKRLYKGKLPQTLVPLWFDEGVALQNDEREKYGEAAWKNATGNGEKEVSLDEIASASGFYSAESEERVVNYIVSKHEVKRWIARNGMGGLLALIDRVNAGESFNRLYFTE